MNRLQTRPKSAGERKRTRFNENSRASVNVNQSLVHTKQRDTMAKRIRETAEGVESCTTHPLLHPVEWIGIIQKLISFPELFALVLSHLREGDVLLLSSASSKLRCDILASKQYASDFSFFSYMQYALYEEDHLVEQSHHRQPEVALPSRLRLGRRVHLPEEKALLLKVDSMDWRPDFSYSSTRQLDIDCQRALWERVIRHHALKVREYENNALN